MQTFTYEVEIVPDCDSAVVEQLETFSFPRIVKGHIDTVDFTNFYTFDTEGAYDSFCGGLEYILDPSGTPSPQTYLVYDGAFLLTLAPLDGTHTDST